MTFGSVCSGIEAASVAWHPLGWRSAWFAEIEPFTAALLKHHYPEVPNYGDFTNIRPRLAAAGISHRRDSPDALRDAGAGAAEPINLLVGGTPCQSFSVAGKRAGLDDPRGNLTLEFFALAGRLRPRWVVWENVPGVLSDDGGHTFGTVLGILGKLGYGAAYRILDAQYFGVPQRRRRVFVVGHLGDWRRAAAVLFERHCLSGNTPPRREAREDVAGSLGGGSGERGWCSDTERMTFVPEVSYALNAHPTRRYDAQANETFVAGVAGPVTSNPYGDHESRESLLVAHALRADGFDASEDGTGRGTPIVAFRACGQDGFTPNRVAPPLCSTDGGGTVPTIAFSCKDSGSDAGELAPTLRSMGHDQSHANAGGQVAVAFTERGRDRGRTFEFQEECAYCLTNPGSGGRTHSRQVITPQMAVRRLTTRECERLQGFPDDYTAIPYRGKPASDGPRYRAIGNSMAVPVMRWIGERIAAVDAL